MLEWEMNEYGEFTWIAPDTEDGTHMYEQLDAEISFNI